MSLVEEKYGQHEEEKENIVQYIQMCKSEEIDPLEKARKIIMFYVRESFYYKILNTMLRTMKTSD